MPENVPPAPNQPATVPMPAWESAAKRLLRTEMRRREWRYQRLSSELKVKLGIVESAGRLNRKVNRGRFSAGFLLACLEVLGVEEIRMADVCASMPEKARLGADAAATGVVPEKQ